MAYAHFISGLPIKHIHKSYFIKIYIILLFSCIVWYCDCDYDICDWLVTVLTVNMWCYIIFLTKYKIRKIRKREIKEEIRDT